jgi:hypothetical protein
VNVYNQTARLRALLASLPAGSALPDDALAEMIDLLGLPPDYAAQAVVIPMTGFGKPGVRLLDVDGRQAGPDFCLLGPGSLPVYGVPADHQRRHLGGFGDGAVAVPSAEAHAPEPWIRLALALRRLDPDRKGVSSGHLHRHAGISRPVYDLAVEELVGRGLARRVEVKAGGRRVAGVKLLSMAAGKA